MNEKPASMSEQCFEVCRRRVMYGAPQSDIADDLGITQQRVSQHLVQAERQFPQLAKDLRRSRRGRPRKSA